MRNSFDWNARSERLVCVGVERPAAARSLVKHWVFMRMIMLSVDDDDDDDDEER